MRSDWLEGLNPEQQEAVLHREGPLLVLAGAGSGKTTTLVARTGSLIDSRTVAAKSMTVLTFTNKAARELKHRVAHRLGGRSEGLWAGTFHSFGLQILRAHSQELGLPPGFGILDQNDSVALVKELLKNIRNVGKDAFKAETLLSMLCTWREKGQRKAKSDDEYEVMTQVLLPHYEKRLQSLGVVDFTSLLLMPLELLRHDDQALKKWQSRCDHLLVDEFQDTNDVQFGLVQLLIQHTQNIAVVGDDDQSIYGWRGACVRNILDFPKHYKGAKVIRLERNYRSSPAILDLANHVISKNADRHGKTLKSDPRREKGVKPELFVYENDTMEAEEVIRQIRHYQAQGYRLSQMAILYRANTQGAWLESFLRQDRIEYGITGGTGLFERKETKDVLAHLRCALSPNDVAFRRLLHAPARGIGDTTIEKVTEWGQKHGLRFFVAARKWRDAGVAERIGESLDAVFRELGALPDQLLSEKSTPSAELVKYLTENGYRRYLQEQARDEVGFQKRWQIVEILGRLLDRFLPPGERQEKNLLKFLDHLELRNDDSDEEQKADRVSLMTFHAAKGLEFPVVFLLGVEEDLLPHRNLGHDVSEERRLFYVGLTRAKEHLLLSRVRARQRYGQLQKVTPSRFVTGIPTELLTVYEHGTRPVNADQRENLLADLYKQLNAKMAVQKVET